MGGQRVAVESDRAVPLDAILQDGVRGDARRRRAGQPRRRTQLCVLVWHYHDDDVPGPTRDGRARRCGPAAQRRRRRTLTHYRIDDDAQQRVRRVEADGLARRSRRPSSTRSWSRRAARGAGGGRADPRGRREGGGAAESAAPGGLAVDVRPRTAGEVTHAVSPRRAAWPFPAARAGTTAATPTTPRRSAQKKTHPHARGDRGAAGCSRTPASAPPQARQ